MKKPALLLLCLLLAAAGFGATITLEPGTPVFRTPELPSEVIAVASARTELPETGSKLVLIQRHPLARYYRLSEVRLPDGRSGYTHPRILLTPDGNLDFGNMLEWWRYPLAVLLCGGLAALAVTLWKRRREEDPWRRLELGLLPVLLRMTLLVLLVNSAQNIIAAPADETGYYSNLIHFLAGDFSERWHFTVGTSIFYLPFELLSGTRQLADLLIPVSWAEGFLIAPLSLFLGYLIARKLTGSDRKACAAMLIWAVLPFVWHHRPDFTGRLFIAFFEFPSAEFSYRHYINLIACGFSAMSDTPSTMLVLLCMTILLYCRVSRRSAALAAFVFGVSCMFRINNILFLPAIAAIVWLRQPEYLAGVRRTLTNAAAGAGAFLLGFLPQMLANWKFFGSPLKFSYTNYAEGAHTYLHWSFIELNSAFYGTVNQLVWIPGLLSLLFLKDRKLRIILALWAVPVIWFFFGYSHGTDDPIRFILTSYPAFFIAIAACGVWDKLTRSQIGWLLLILAGWIVCIPNASYGSFGWYFAEPHHLLWRTGLFPPLQAAGTAAMAAGSVALFLTRRKLGIFTALASVLYLLGNAYWLALGLAAVLLLAVWDMAQIGCRTWKLRQPHGE